MSTLAIHSTRFGRLAIPADATIEFPAGLIGVGGRRFALIATDPTNPFQWLHSVDGGDFAIPVTDPWEFFPDYEVELSAEDAARTGADAAESVAVCVTVCAAGDLGELTANLRAPILITDGRGHQVLNAAPATPLRAPLFPDDYGQQAA